MTRSMRIKESFLRSEATKKLALDGWQVWYPPYSRARIGGASNDLWGVFDLECLKPGCMVPLYIQLTVMSGGSRSNVNARRRKIETWEAETGLTVTWQVWGWDTRQGGFQIFEAV